MLRVLPVFLVALAIGCASETSTPLTADGPNQVLITVPSMT
jgi:hypothetical protein